MLVSSWITFPESIFQYSEDLTQENGSEATEGHVEILYNITHMRLSIPPP